MRMLPLQSFRTFLALALVALTLLATGCATVKVADTTPREYLAARRGDILSTGQLSHATTSALFSRGIVRKSCERDASRCIQRLFDAVIRYVPETKGRSLEVIQDLWRKPDAGGELPPSIS
jgi:hypothetical protein